jgi:hypothetical protein
MSCHLILFPRELFLLLSDYLLDTGKKKVFKFNDDWKSFMNTSKAHFAELKRQTRYIALKENSNQFLVDAVFRQRILSLVHDPSLQVSCYFRVLGTVGQHYNATVLCNLNLVQTSNFMPRSLSVITNVEAIDIRTFSSLTDFTGFGQITKNVSISIYPRATDGIPTYDLSCLSPTLETLNLCVNRVANYHLFTNLREVAFDCCESITDVSCFRNAKTVTFTRCPNVTNVNSLAKVKKLILAGCEGVTDVSALGSVKEMVISDCINLADLSALSTVHILTVSQFSEILLAPLKQNVVLDLSFSSFSLSSIQFLAGNKLLRVLDISNNENIRDVSMLDTVEVLRITGCPLITSLAGLAALKELDMNLVDRIESGFEVLQQLTKLSIGNVVDMERTVKALEKAPSLSSLTLNSSELPFDTLIQVKDLTLNYSAITEFPSTLIHLNSLKMVFCHYFMSFPTFLPCLQFLEIEGSNKLSLLRFLDGEANSRPLNHVKISHCAGLKEIQISRRISSLDISRDCQSLKEISGKEFVRSLKER